MKKIIFILFIFSGLYAQCSEMDVMECGNDNNCEWLENIESVTCASLVLDEELCEAAPECVYSCDDGGGYFGWCTSSCTGGMTYIDSGYCQEIEMPDCSEMNETECTNNNDCNWIDEIITGNCSDITNGSECYQTNQCSWYNAGPYGYWYDNCYGGTYEIDNSYCQDLPYILGDLDLDGNINVLDIIDLVQIVLNSEYDIIGDINQDGVNNIGDIILLVNIVLGRR